MKTNIDLLMTQSMVTLVGALVYSQNDHCWNDWSTFLFVYLLFVFGINVAFCLIDRLKK